MPGVVDDIVGKVAGRVIDYMADEAVKNANDKREYAGRAAERAERHNAAQAAAEAKADRDYDALVNRHRRLASASVTTVEEASPGIDRDELARMMTAILVSHEGRVDLETLDSVFDPFVVGHLAAADWPNGNTGKAVVLGAFALLADALDDSSGDAGGIRNLASDSQDSDEKSRSVPDRRSLPTRPSTSPRDVKLPPSALRDPVWTPPPVISDPKFPIEPELPDEENPPR